MKKGRKTSWWSWHRRSGGAGYQRWSLRMLWLIQLAIFPNEDSATPGIIIKKREFFSKKAERVYGYWKRGIIPLIRYALEFSLVLWVRLDPQASCEHELTHCGAEARQKCVERLWRFNVSMYSLPKYESNQSQFWSHNYLELYQLLPSEPLSSTSLLLTPSFLHWDCL